MKKSPKRGTPTHLAFHCVDELVLTTCNGKRHLESSPFLLCRKGSTAMLISDVARVVEATL